ncbi:MAG: N-acetylmuramoyl-L-alanine amidase [Oscillospiraceae bacterium]|nr:N-acetylmuramoyl-L-alanine amidase [Oscillospiraceae bacterium]
MNYTIQTPNPALQFRNNPGYRSRTTAYVLHHVGNQRGSAQPISINDIHRWHLDNGWAGCGYHFYVRRNGDIFRGRPIDWVGSHAAGHNADTIGICVEGNYETVDRVMPDAQFNALVWLLRDHLGPQFGALPIWGHRDIAATACPGRYFPMDEVRRLQFRGEQNNDPQEGPEMTEAQVKAMIAQMLEDRLAGHGTTPSPWAQGELTEAVNAGITDGTRPQGYATRQEVAIMAHRAAQARRE